MARSTNSAASIEYLLQLSKRMLINVKLSPEHALAVIVWYNPNLRLACQLELPELLKVRQVQSLFLHLKFEDACRPIQR